MDLASNRTVYIALLLANFAWFGAGFYQFTFRARTAFLNGITRRPGAAKPTHVDHSADVFRYLGAMGGSLALSTLPKLFELLSADAHSASSHDASLQYLWRLWGAAHASQAMTTLLVVAPSKRWRWSGFGLGMITYIDLTLWAANWAMWWAHRDSPVRLV